MSNDVALRVKRAFHPSLHVPSLDDAAEFFDRVFARTSQPLMVMPRSDTPRAADAPTYYSAFTMISDVLIDCVDPKRHLTNGVQHFPTVEEPVLQNIGWYCNDIDETYRALRGTGIPLVTQFGEPAEGDEPPVAGQGGSMKMFFTPPNDVGLRYQFLPWFPLPADPRSDPDWTVPPVSDDDPLAIEHCSHHVILTEQPDRAVRLVVDALGGTVIHEGRDDVREIAGPYVHLADAVFHFAVPEPGTHAAAVLAGALPADKYHALTWKVSDLGRVASHLERSGVVIANRNGSTIVTDVSTGFGVPWGFTTDSVPGDPRG
jgi:hypothetical protein